MGIPFGEFDSSLLPVTKFFYWFPLEELSLSMFCSLKSVRGSTWVIPLWNRPATRSSACFCQFLQCMTNLSHMAEVLLPALQMPPICFQIFSHCLLPDWSPVIMPQTTLATYDLMSDIFNAKCHYAFWATLWIDSIIYSWFSPHQFFDDCSKVGRSKIRFQTHVGTSLLWF